MRLLGSLLLHLLVLASGLAAQAAPPAADTTLATLQPGDVLRIAIWREEELSGEFQIDETGRVTLPLLGERQAAGKAPRALRDELIRAYRTHLANPSIMITPLRRIYILGQVAKPGLYVVDPTITLAGAIALAGGSNAEGDLSRIRVVRKGVVVQPRISAETALTTGDIRSDDQIFVERRSWFERNSAFVVSIVLSVTSTVVSILLR